MCIKNVLSAFLSLLILCSTSLAYAHVEISCFVVGHVQAKLYKDYCYDYSSGKTDKCSNFPEMRDFKPDLYSVRTELYVYTKSGVIQSKFIPMQADTVEDICLNSFTPNDTSATPFVGIDSHYPTDLGHFSSSSISSSKTKIVITPVVSQSHKAEHIAFCKSDFSPYATAADICPD